MGYVFPDFILAYVVAAILSFIAAVIVLRRRGNPGYVAFGLMMISLSLWSSASIFEAGATTVSEKLIWAKCEYIGVATLPALWLFFAADFTHQKKFSNRTRIAFLIIPVVTLVVAFFEERLYLLWSKVEILPGPYHIAKFYHGPYFYVHIIYSYVLLFIGTYWLVKALLKFPISKRRQVYIIICVLVVGWTANILYVTGLFPVPGLDITPLSFTLIAFVISWNLFQFRLFDIMPIARDMLMDSMADGVIVMDVNDVIIDINPHALKLINKLAERPLLGLTLEEALGDKADVLKTFKGKSDFSAELKVSEKPPQYIGFSVSTIKNEQKQDVGKIVVIYDITKRKLMEIKEAEQRKLAEALATVAGIINSTLDLNEVLEKILENVGKVVPHDAANIALLDIDQKVHFVKIKGYEKFGTEKYIKSIECRIDEIPNLRKMAETHRASFNSNTQTDPGWIKDMPGSSWIKSYMGAPIFGKGKLLGFINLDAETSDFFKEEYIPRLEAFANQVAVAVENAQYFKEIAESAHAMTILYEVGLAVTSGLGVDKAILTLFNQLKTVVPIDLFFIAMLDAERENAIYTMYQEDGQRVEFGPVSMKDYPSLTRYVIGKCKTVYIPDILAKDSEYPKENLIKIPGHNERSNLGIPLILRDQVQGALFLLAQKPNAYNADQIRLVETITNQVSVAMDNARLFEQVQLMAITDALTGIYNRRYFFTIGENEMARAQRYGSNLSLIMLDIDHFKKVNDEFGHLVGDQTLVMITQACSNELRKIDILCRYGGEEFVILLPETSRDEAIIAAERIRKSIEEQTLTLDGNREVKVTVSIGVSEFGQETGTLKELIDEADQALYRAKEEGRNCVRYFDHSLDK